MKIRGTLTVVSAEHHDYEFRAQRSTGVSTQQEVKTAGSSKLYRTTGEKQPKLVAHLSVPASSPDPAAEMQQLLQRLTKDMQLKAAPRLRGRVLMQKDGLRVTLNNRSGEVECILRIPLAAPGGLQGTLIKQMQQISQCFAINKTSLAPQKR